MKYLTATRALMAGILKILSRAYLKYYRLIWETDCICQLQWPVTTTAYLVEFRGHRKFITICGKFAAVSHGIWQTGLQNLEKFAAENCGPWLWMTYETGLVKEARVWTTCLGLLPDSAWHRVELATCWLQVRSHNHYAQATHHNEACGTNSQACHVWLP